MDFMVRRASGEDLLILDCGYARDAEPVYNRLRQAGLGLRNFETAGMGRLLATLPPTRLARLRTSCPEIRDGGVYWQTTHHWVGLSQQDEQ